MVQHGLLVPQAPPLPVGCTPAGFQRGRRRVLGIGRRDVTTHAVGSQLLYLASQKATGAEAQKQNDLEPIFLGQMHGAELPRASFALRFALLLEEVRRKLPSAPEREGQAVGADPPAVGEGRYPIDRSGTPLNEVPNPVVSIFSTGVLGLQSAVSRRVYHPAPPAWLVEFGTVTA